MIDFLLISFCSSLCVLAVYMLINLYFGIDLYLDKVPFGLLRKPLYDCLVCMSSIWGGGFFCGFYWVFSEVELIKIPFGILTIAGFMVIYSLFLENETAIF